MLVDEMRRGAARLSLSGPNGSRDVLLIAEAGCPSIVELVAEGGVNAWADGDRVMIGDGLLMACSSDDELAFVIAHEMAHNLLHHRQRLAASAPSGSRQSSQASSIVMREAEEEADRMGANLAIAAGYDLSNVDAFLGHLLDHRASAETHPEASRRLMLLRAAVAVRDQRAGGGASTARILNTDSSDRVSGRI